MVILGPIAVAVVAVLVSRARVVYGLAWPTNRRRPVVSGVCQHVLFWGGLRGTISLALTLSLPAAFTDRELVRVMTFGVVLFTLLAQGPAAVAASAGIAAARGGRIGGRHDSLSIPSTLASLP